MAQPKVLLTGGAGFFGRILKRRVLELGYECVSIDVVRDDDVHERLTRVQGDLRDSSLVHDLFRRYAFDGVLHCAAMLAHGSHLNEQEIWTCNVDGTRTLAEACLEHQVKNLVFTSTNCLWAKNLGHAIQESEPPQPAEAYGRSKLAAETLLKEYADKLNVVIIRCPTIIDSGRLGLLGILFEFIDDNKTIWMVGKGSNRYQFIYAGDLADACVKALRYGQSDLFHIGSDHVGTLREVFRAVIRAAQSKSEIRSLPKGITLAAMQMAHGLGMSPLGPYHYKMIAEDFLFDTTRIKQRLGWKPTLTNAEMLVRAYFYYKENRKEIESRSEASAHRKVAPMGAIRILKWIS
jgi:UDP-glucose 4-epimerase